MKLDTNRSIIDQATKLGAYSFVSIVPFFLLKTYEIEGSLLSLKDTVKLLKLGSKWPMWCPTEFEEIKKELLDDDN